MRAYAATVAFGWLVFIGTAHFIVDVVSQYARGKRPPGIETSLYYGLNSSFALGQVLFGLTCLWIANQQPAFLRSLPIAALCLVAAIGWLVIAFMFMEYWEPKANTGVFALLLIVAIASAR